MNRFGLFDKIVNIIENIKNDIFMSEYVNLRSNHMSRNIQYWSIDGEYIIYLTRNGVKDEL